jgi:hypothetical protein
MKAYCYTASAWGVLMPFVLLVLLLIKPDMPPFIGWIVWHPGDHIIKNILLSLGNLLAFLSLVSSNVTSVVYVTLLELHALFTYLRQLRVQSKTNEDSLSTKLCKKRLFKLKQVQLLSIMFNECFQWIFFTWFLFLLYIVVSVNLFAFVKFWKEVSLLGSMFLMVVFTQTLAFVVIISSVAGYIYCSSKAIPKAWLRSPVVYRNIRVRKAVAACSGIKIRIGSVNFVDRLTPFVVSGLCLKLAVRMLMATSK